MSKFLNLSVGDNFIDGDLISEDKSLVIQIIGDHVYTITDNKSRIIVVSDVGNTNGIVLSVTDFSDRSILELEAFVTKTTGIESKCLAYDGRVIVGDYSGYKLYRFNNDDIYLLLNGNGNYELIVNPQIKVGEVGRIDYNGNLVE